MRGGLDALEAAAKRIGAGVGFGEAEQDDLLLIQVGGLGQNVPVENLGVE